MFRWHAVAVLYGPDGAAVTRPGTFAPLMPDRPGVAALCAVLAGNGAAFRIGGSGALAAPPGCFEALTGGSLGTPRRIVRSQASWCASFAVNAGLFGIGPGVPVAVPGRLAHSLALYGAVEGLTMGASVHLLDGLRPDAQAREMALRRVAVLYATPAQVHGIVAADMALPALRHVLIGGAALDAGLAARLRALAPNAQVHVFYGAAEASFITLAHDGSPPGPHPGTVGHPYPGVQVRILDHAGQDAPEGDIWVRSPYLFQSYAGPDAGSAAWCNGWLGLGEVGCMTGAGLVLRGRAGRMVTVADRNVFPEEIEAFLMRQPGVDRAAVLPVPDAARGAVLVAWLAGDPACQRAILAAARAELGPMLAPRRITWLRDWPELPSGKTDLAALAQGAAPWR